MRSTSSIARAGCASGPSSIRTASISAIGDHVASRASAIGLGSVAVGVGTFHYQHPQPIGEDDARALADAYNQRLRRRLGLPPAPRRALLRDVTLTPYAAGRAAGAVVGARF